MFKKLAIAGLCALSAAAFITGCGSSQKPASSAAASAPAEKKEITVGATAGPHAEVVEAAAKEAEKNGLKVNVKEFSDYITPDQALADGDLDIVVYQHKPFMETSTNSTAPISPISAGPSSCAWASTPIR